MYKKIKQDERGITHLLLIVLVLVVVAVIGVAVWRIESKSKPATASNSSSTTSNTVSSSCLATYHDSNLCHFSEFSTDFSKTAYTAKITLTQSGAASAMTLENDGKGNTELTGTSGGQTINSVTLNGKVYIQSNGTGPWIEYPSGTTAPSSTNPTSSMNIAVGSTGVSFKYIGTVSCGSLTCYKYQVTDSATPNSTQYVLFDKGSYKLREWQYTDSTGNTTDMKVSYGSVNITTPSPVQSL